MTIQSEELYTQTDRSDVPNMAPAEGHAKVLVFASDANATQLLMGTPVARNTSTGFMVPWTQGGSNGTGTIVAFVYEMDAAKRKLVNGSEVQIVCMTGGALDRNEINTTDMLAILGGSPTEGNLDDALEVLQGKGFDVHNLATYPS